MLIWASLVGGNFDDEGRGGLVLDDDDDVWVFGRTKSSDYPVTPSAFQMSISGMGSFDACVSKLSSDGTTLLWSSYIGGSDDEVVEGGICKDFLDNIIVFGKTFSTDFPVNGLAYQTSNQGNSDAFIAKFDNQGNVQWSSYLGGSQDEDAFGGCKCNANNEIYFHGNTNSTDYPSSIGVFGPSKISPMGVHDVFLSKFNENGSFIWSSFFGGELR